MVEAYADIASQLERRQPIYRAHSASDQKSIKAASVSEYGNCAFDDRFGCVVHLYRPAQRECVCGKQVTPEPVKRMGVPQGFRRATKNYSNVDYVAGWAQFQS